MRESPSRTQFCATCTGWFAPVPSHRRQSMSSILNKTARVFHRQHGFFVSDSWTDAPVGKWGTKDGDLFEVLGDLKDVNIGVPDPKKHSIARTPRWFLDEGVSVGKWTVKGGVPGGLA